MSAGLQEEGSVFVAEGASIVDEDAGAGAQLQDALIEEEDAAGSGSAAGTVEDGLGHERVAMQDMGPRRFRVRLAPGKILRLQLEYRPFEAQRIEFMLPLRALGMMPAKEREMVGRVVTGRAVPPRLALKPALANFQLKVVHPDPMRRAPYRQQVSVESRQESGTVAFAAGRYWLDAGAGAGSGDPSTGCFRLQDSDGDLVPKESGDITVLFSPPGF